MVSLSVRAPGPALLASTQMSAITLVRVLRVCVSISVILVVLLGVVLSRVCCLVGVSIIIVYSPNFLGHLELKCHNVEYGHG